MTVDHLIDHVTDPSTIRGMIWTLGAVVALSMIGRGDPKGALEVLTQTALAVGAVGVLTRDHPRSEPVAQPPPDIDDGK
jgi:predicted anti-sigma-YlaC factor YlaD